MQEMIARLIDCGMPRSVAVCVCNYFKADPKKLACYVDEVEKEAYGEMEAV